MSVSIEVGFSVYGLSLEHSQAVWDLFERVVRDKQFEGYVEVVRRDSRKGDVDVRVVSLQPVTFSGFYRWRPAFEERLQREVSGLVSGVEVSFEWDYPELELEEEAVAAAEAAKPLPAPANWPDFALRQALAQHVVYALSQGLKIQMPNELTVRAWNDEGGDREPEVAVLGLMREPKRGPYVA